MEKIIGEDEIKGLEEEIDSAVDRLFVEKRRGLDEALSIAPPLFEPSYEIGKTMKLESPLEPSALKPSHEIEKTFELETSQKSSVLEPPYETIKPVEFEKPFFPPAEPPPVFKSIEKIETQLLSLEWEITEENIKKTKEEILTLREDLAEKSDVVSILNLMEKVLNHMIKNEDDIRPSLIKFLLDSKDTIKLMLKKGIDNETDIYKHLAFLGLEARFSCLEELGDSRMRRPPLILNEQIVRTENLTMVEKKIEEMLNKMNMFSERMDERLMKINQRLSELERAPLKSSEHHIGMRSQPVDITVFKIDDRLFGVESDKVFKLFKLPDTFREKVSDQQKIRLKDVEVRIIDLRKCLSIGGEEQKGEIRILALKDNGEYKGLRVDQVLKKVYTHSEIGGDYGDYFLGVIHWTYQKRFVEIPILDLKKF